MHDMISSHLITIYDNGNVSYFGTPNDENANHAYYLSNYLREKYADTRFVQNNVTDNEDDINSLAVGAAYVLNVTSILNIRTINNPTICLCLPEKIDDNLASFLKDNAQDIDNFTNIDIMFPDIINDGFNKYFSYRGIEIAKENTPEDTINRIITTINNIQKRKSKRM